MRFRDLVDDAWAAWFGISVEQLRTPGTHVVRDAPALPGYAGIYVLRLGAALVVAGRVDDPAPMTRALGPSQHAYLHRDDFVPPPTIVARPVTAADDVDRFRAAVPDEEWHEGGFGDGDLPAVTWVALDGDRIVAMGNMTDFAGRPADVGLVVHPRDRGTGVGTALAADMVAACFADGVEVARYRALTSNVASLRVAAKLGFTPYGENVAIRFS